MSPLRSQDPKGTPGRANRPYAGAYGLPVAPASRCADHVGSGRQATLRRGRHRLAQALLGHGGLGPAAQHEPAYNRAMPYINPSGARRLGWDADQMLAAHDTTPLLGNPVTSVSVTSNATTADVNALS